MRVLLLAIALACAPGIAVAQQASPLQQLGAWAQRLSAAQQPLVARYQQCSPITQQMIAVMQTEEAGRAQRAMQLIAPMRQCVTDMRAAVIQVRDALAAMPPMPHQIELALHIDSKDLLTRTAAAAGGMAVYLEKSEEMLEAVLAGDQALARTRMAEAHQSAGAALDAQIILFETMRQSMPLQTHKSMFDVRLAMYRSMRAIIAADPEHDSGQLSVALRGYGADARLAGAQLRANWKRESASMRAALLQLHDPARTRMMASMDNAFETIAQTGDAMAATLEKLPDGPTNPVTAAGILNQFGALEVRMLASINEMGAAARQVQ